MKSNFLDPLRVVEGTHKLRNTFPVLVNGVNYTSNELTRSCSIRANSLS